MKINWGKIFEYALAGGIILKTVSDIDDWINERTNGLRYDNSYLPTLVETAYNVANMNGDLWSTVKAQLSLKAINNQQAEFLLSYCNYVVALEKSVQELLTYSLRDGVDILTMNLQNMKDYEMAAHYGIIQAYAENNMKAKALLQSFNRLLN